MFKKLVILSTLLVALLIIVSSTSAPVEAGTNGQQLFFYIYSGQSRIAWIKVEGTNQYGRATRWSGALNPPATSYSLNNWWWKGRTWVEWRMADGRSGGCLFDIPVKGRDWIAVGVDRQPGNSCWVN